MLPIDNQFVSTGASIITPAATDFIDSLQNTPVTISGITTTRRNIQAVLRLGTTARQLKIDTVNNSAGTTQAEVSMNYRIDGGPVHQLGPTLINPGINSYLLGLDGNSHTIEIWDGFQAWTTGTTVVGAYTYQVSSRGGTTTILTAPAVSTKMVFYGDSITSGAVATITETQGFAQLTKANWSAARVAIEAWSGRQLFDDLSGGQAGPGSVSAMATRLAGLVAGATTKIVWFAMGFNDWNVPTYTAANFGTACGQLFDQIHLIDPAITIYAQTLFITNREANNNGNGEKPPAFRTALATAQSTRSSFVILVDGTTLMAPGGLFDGIHPTGPGHQGIYNGTGGQQGTNNIKAILGF